LKFDVGKLESPRADRQETIGLSFITASPDGMLLYRQASRAESTHGLLLQLKQRQLVLTVFEDSSEPLEIRTDSSFSDNKLHSAFLILDVDRVVLRVDDEVVSDTRIVSNFNEGAGVVSLSVIYIAGMPGDENSMGKVLSNFEG
jgi:hypothetical protein